VRYAYVYAIALNSTGAPGQAIQLLERAHRLFPADKDVLVALVSIARATGDRGTALEHARELAELDSGDIQVRRLVEELERLRPR
jgi:predicted Zn-dependent protease